MTATDQRTERLNRLSPAKRALLIKALRQELAPAEDGGSVRRRAPEGFAPMSFAQQRLWFLHQLEPDDPAYNVAAAVRLTGALDVAALEESLNEIVRRHEVLRTTCAKRDGEPVQVIAPELRLRISVKSLADLPEGEREAQQVAREEAQRPFDLQRGPVLRVNLLRMSGNEHVLLLTMHHIVADGWSMGVLIREVATLYEAFTAGRPSPLADLPIQYADYAAWQRDWLTGAVLDEQLSYWKQQLNGAPAALDFPTDRERRAGQSHQGAVESLVLDRGLTEQVRALSQREGVTLFMTLLAAFKTLLYRSTGQQDIIVGTPIANRNRPEIEGLIGFFVNMLALRTQVGGDLRFQELLARVRETALGAYAHQDLPFEKLVESLQPRRKPHHTPLFQVTFVLQNVPLSQNLSLPDLTLTPFEVGVTAPQYDLTLTIWEGAEELTARMAYKPALFESATITRLLRRYERLLRRLVAQPQTHLDAVEMASEAEKRRQIIEGKARQDANFEKLLNIKPKGVSLSPHKFIKTGHLRPDETLPLVIQPNVGEVNLAVWAKDNREFIEVELLKHGAILFRGFHLNSLPKFEQFVRAISPELFDYRERSSPRTELGQQIYTSTDHPPDQWIEMHNEHSYSHQWPMKIWFGCLRAAREGGETPVASNRKVLKLLDGGLVERLRQKKVRYVRNYGDGLGVPWETAFQTTDRAEVEEYCRRAGIRFEWKDDKRLHTWQVREAVSTHPKTGEVTWFNHLNIYNVALLEPGARASLLSLFKEEDLPFNTYYGDGSPIESSALLEIREAYRKSIVAFAWRDGDVLMLDNMLVAHGRKPYKGPRKIVVAMGDLFTANRA